MTGRDELTARLAGLDTRAVSDALDRLGRAGHPVSQVMGASYEHMLRDDGRKGNASTSSEPRRHRW